MAEQRTVPVVYNQTFFDCNIDTFLSNCFFYGKLERYFTAILLIADMYEDSKNLHLCEDLDVMSVLWEMLQKQPYTSSLRNCV